MTFWKAVNSLHVRSLLVLLLAVTPALLGMLSAGAEWRRHDMAEAEADSLKLARHAAAIYERVIEETEQSLHEVASRLRVPPKGPGVENLFANVSGGRLVVTRMGVVTLDSGSLPPASPAAGGADNADRVLFRHAVDSGRLVVGSFGSAGNVGRRSVTVAYSVSDSSGRPSHVMFAVLSPDWIRELAIEAALPEATTVSILDEHGTIVLQVPGAPERVGRSGLQEFGLQELPLGSGETITEAASADGTQRLFVIKPLRADTGRVYLVVGIPKHVVLAAVDSTLARINGWFMVAIGLAIIVATVGNRMTVLRPLARLAETTKRLGGGDLGARTGLRRLPEELRQLAKAFDEMAAMLEQREHDIAVKTEQLASQGRRFRALVENSADGIILVDQDGTVQYASPSTERILGYSPEEMVGRPAFASIHPDEQDAVRARFDHHLADPSVDVWARTRARHKDGSWRWLESVGTNLLADPAVKAIVINYRDITLRLEAEGELRRAHDELELRVETRTSELLAANIALQAEIRHRARVEETLRKLSRAIEQTSDCVFLTDHDGVIEYVNPAFVRLTGFSSEEAIGARPNLIRSDHHDRRFFEKMWTTILSGEVFRAVFTNKAKDGRLFYQDTTITPLRDRQGAITDFVSTGRDITKLRRAAEALRRLNDRLEHEAIRIASALHDEAGQFLTAAHITLADVARELPPSSRDRLQDVRQNLDEVEQQLRRLAHELRPRIVDDMGLADALKFLADGVSRRTGIPIGVDVSLQTRCLPPVETAIYRLVQEGLTNMSKHARATRGTIVLSQNDESIRCSVSDDGVGFDMSATPAEREKLGLGLLGIQDRLEAIDGVLEVISSPGQGTELRAIIPLES